MRRPTGPVAPGSVVAGRTLTPLAGSPMNVPEAGCLTHLQFRRFAGCPVCNLHLRSVVRRHDEIEAAGVREVVLFHAPADDLRGYVAGMPFAVVADPDKRLYKEFGVESTVLSLLHPRAWLPILRAVALSLRRGGKRPPVSTPHGGRFGLPADFLIDGEGRVVARKYGAHAYDQWSVDELLALVAAHAASREPAAR